MLKTRGIREGDGEMLGEGMVAAAAAVELMLKDSLTARPAGWMLQSRKGKTLRQLRGRRTGGGLGGCRTARRWLASAACLSCGDFETKPVPPTNNIKS